MRTYGEGFIIADQSPADMDSSAIRNTQTKVFFMLPERDDRAVAASSLELEAEQQKELTRLPIGMAIVYQNAWEEPILAKIKYFDKSWMKPYHYMRPNVLKENKELRTQVLATLLYRRMIVENGVSSYDEGKIQKIYEKEYSWLGDIEILCKEILADREELVQSKASASRIAETYSWMVDFEKQLASLNDRMPLNKWLNNIKLQISKLTELSQDEINELIELLIFHRKTVNSGGLKLYVEYQKLKLKYEGEIACGNSR